MAGAVTFPRVGGRTHCSVRVPLFCKRTFGARGDSGVLFVQSLAQVTKASSKRRLRRVSRRGLPRGRAGEASPSGPEEHGGYGHWSATAALNCAGRTIRRNITSTDATHCRQSLGRARNRTYNTYISPQKAALRTRQMSLSVPREAGGGLRRGYAPCLSAQGAPYLRHRSLRCRDGAPAYRRVEPLTSTSRIDVFARLRVGFGGGTRLRRACSSMLVRERGSRPASGYAEAFPAVSEMPSILKSYRSPRRRRVNSSERSVRLGSKETMRIVRL